MDDEILFVLRILAGVSLLSFLGWVVYFLYRDQSLITAKHESRRHSFGRLVVVSNGESKPPSGATFPILSTTTLGRSTSNTIQIDDRYASGEHARLVQRMGRWWLEDQQSSNGTQLNGVLVEEPVVLTSGDVITIGSVQFRLELD